MKLQKIVFIALLLVKPVFGQNPVSPTPLPPTFVPVIYTDSTGLVYVQPGVELYFWLSEAKEKSTFYRLNPEPASPQALVLSRHRDYQLIHTGADNQPQNQFRIMADGQAPQTTVRFDEGLRVSFGKRFYCQQGTKLHFSARDQDSGIKATYFALDEGDFQLWNKVAIPLQGSGYFSIHYFSVDQVGNAEQVQSIDIIFDLEAVIQLDNIYFEHNSSELNASARRQLDLLAQSLREFPGLSILLMSHTDSRGAASYNLRLSEQRAQTTRQYLISKGINAARLQAKGLGETQLLNHCVPGVDCTEEEHAINRRTEFKLLPIN